MALEPDSVSDVDPRSSTPLGVLHEPLRDKVAAESATPC